MGGQRYIYSCEYMEQNLVLYYLLLTYFCSFLYLLIYIKKLLNTPKNHFSLAGWLSNSEKYLLFYVNLRSKKVY